MGKGHKPLLISELCADVAEQYSSASQQPDVSNYKTMMPLKYMMILVMMKISDCPFAALNLKKYCLVK